MLVGMEDKKTTPRSVGGARFVVSKNRNGEPSSSRSAVRGSVGLGGGIGRSSSWAGSALDEERGFIADFFEDDMFCFLFQKKFIRAFCSS